MAAKRVLVALLSVLVIGAVVLAVVALGGDDDDGGGPSTTAPTTTLGEVSETGEELLALLDRGRDLPLHLLFEPEPADGGEASGSLVVELWRSDGRVRQDLRLSAVAGAVRTEVSAFELPDGNVICQRSGEQDWVCQPSLSTATEDGRPSGLIESAAANLRGADVVVRDDTILDVPVRCFAIQGAQGGSSTMCVSEDGVPLRIAVEAQVLTATLLEREVDDAAFEPHAAVDDAAEVDPDS